MSRSLLHVSKLDEFKAWLDAQGIDHRPGRGAYEVLQVRQRRGWRTVCSRHHMTEHYSTDRRLDSLIRQFCHEMEGKPLPGAKCVSERASSEGLETGDANRCLAGTREGKWTS